MLVRAKAFAGDLIMADKDDVFLDDADKVRRSTKVRDENLWRDSADDYNLQETTNQHSEYQEISSLISSGSSISELLVKFGEDKLISLGLLKKGGGGVTTFKADKILSEHDTGDSFLGDARQFSSYSGAPMSNMAHQLQKHLEMQPPFGPANLPDSPKISPVPAQNIQFMKGYSLTKSAPAPGLGGFSPSPFAGMSQPRPTTSGSGSAVQDE
jgi:hypothetical protein